jgi:hypothetical protein
MLVLLTTAIFFSLPLFFAAALIFPSSHLLPMICIRSRPGTVAEVVARWGSPLIPVAAIHRPRDGHDLGKRSTIPRTNPAPDPGLDGRGRSVDVGRGVRADEHNPAAPPRSRVCSGGGETATRRKGRPLDLIWTREVTWTGPGIVQPTSIPAIDDPNIPTTGLVRTTSHDRIGFDTLRRTESEQLKPILILRSPI